MIVIPMAGLSSRFFKAGYDLPKYQLLLGSQTVFSWAVSSFKKYFQTDTFVFIYRDVFDTESFIQQEIENLGIKSYQLIHLDHETLGQADTVYQGLKGLEDEELFIFNIDSKLLNFTKPEWYSACDGYLEVFQGEGTHWSFVAPGEGKSVLRTTEKDRVSDLCSNGLYYFKSLDMFNRAVEYSLENKIFVKNELYIAPLYNLLIAEGQSVLYDLQPSDNIQFCGVPDEYIALLAAIEVGDNQ